METSSELIGTCVRSQQVSTDAVEAVPTAFQVTENYVIVAMSNGEIQIFDIHGTRKKAFSSSGGAVWALAIQGDVLAYEDADNLIEVWDLATGDHKGSLQGHTSTIRSLAILSNKKRIISASRDNTIRTWDVAKGHCTSVSTEHTGTVRTIAVSCAEDLLLSGSHDGTACVWRITDDELVCLQTLRGHEGTIFCVSFAENDGSRGVTAGIDASIRVWDTEDGKCLAILQGHSTVVNQMIVTGSKLITSDASGCLCIWSLDNSPRLSHRLETHRLSVMSLDSDRKRIISAGKDGLVRLQGVESGQLLGQVGEEATAVWKVGFVKDGRVILVVLRRGVVMMEIWHVE